MQLSVNGRAEAMPLEFVPAGGGALDWQYVAWFAEMQASENRLRLAALPDSTDGARGLNVDELTVAPRVQTACTEAALVLDGSSGTIDCVLSEAATAAAVPAACRWLIQPGESGQIRITFHQLALEAQFDQLRIFDGATERSQSLLWASGADLFLASLAVEAGGAKGGKGGGGGGGGGGEGGGGGGGPGAAASWRAHEGVVLSADWCPSTGRIVSGGEDGRYKVWDALGRPLAAGLPVALAVGGSSR